MFYYYSACLHLGKTKENFNIVGIIQGVFEVEVFLLTCDSMRCSKEF
jgi:hypothetical protein